MLRIHARGSNNASDRLIGLYLQDHVAAAAAGRALANRTYQNNRDTSYGSDLRRLVAEIDQETDVLKLLLNRAGLRQPRLKVTLALAAERLGRLKLNGRLIRYSPLSRVIELEGLIAGVQAKCRLWQSVINADGVGITPDADVEELAKQAQDQSDMLIKLHGRALHEAFQE